MLLALADEKTEALSKYLAQAASDRAGPPGFGNDDSFPYHL